MFPYMADTIRGAAYMFENINVSGTSVSAYLSGDPRPLMEEGLSAWSVVSDLEAAMRKTRRQSNALSVELLRTANDAMTASASSRPGVLRWKAKESVRVVLGGGKFYVPTATVTDLNDVVAKANEGIAAGDVTGAMQAMLGIMKIQPFLDGNKRTALVAVNAVIGRLGAVIVPPVDADARERFVDGLVRWYSDGDVDSALVEVSGWIHELSSVQHEG